MTRDRIHVADIVDVNIKGRRFFAEVVGKPRARKPSDPIVILPINRNISYRHCAPAQVETVYRKLPPLKPRPRKKPDRG